MQAERRTVTRTRHEWLLPSPCSMEEVGKAMTSAQHNWDAAGPARCVTGITVEARDDEIVIWFEEATWDQDPVGALGREIHRPRSNPRSGNNPEFAAELLAIAALIDAHRAEFDEFLTGLADTVSLSDARARKRQKRSR